MSVRGYCRTLIVFIACRPAMRMTKLTTIASTGRRMKRSVKDFMSILEHVELASRVRRLRIKLWLGREIIVDCHRHAVAQFEHARAYDRLPGFQSLRD